MKITTVQNIKKSIASLTISAMAFSTFGFIVGTPLTAAYAAEGGTCSTITLVSGGTSQTAGYTSTNPLTAAVALLPATYSNGAWATATPTQAVIPPWVDPSTDAAFTTTGATWISTNATWPGGDANTEGTPTESQWRLFSDSFTLPTDATVTSATLSYTSDNAAAVYLNGNETPVATTNASTTDDIYGTTVSGDSTYSNVFSTSFTPVAGVNNLDFVVRNWSAADATTNPTGLLYKADINYCVPAVVTPPSTVQVSILKFVDGAMATASTSDSQSFPMGSSWSAGGDSATSTGSYTLSPTGFGTTTAYAAETSAMALGSNYGTNETTDGAVVGASCNDEKPFALVGYTTGNSLAEAEAATATTTAPDFSNLQNDKYVIVWNHDCASNGGSIGGDVTGGQSANGVLAVTSVTPVKTTATADGTFANGWEYTFNITVPTNEPDVSMKFADWMSTVGSTTIPVAGNMRISSLQASSTDWVTLTAANTYSSPALHITGDLDPATPGRQIHVTVDVAIPSTTVNGSYTTNYGVRSL